MEVLNKVIEDTLRKENTHNILEFNRCDTRFLVQETINSREVWPIGDFIVKLDEIWCNCDKFQKLHMPCSHVVATCKHAHPVYMLESVSNVYKGLFEELYNEAYWPLTKVRPFSTCIHTEIDIREPGQPKRCSVCCIAGHSKKNYPYRVGSNQQR
uniref:SWIM-type domain-containing protein n=1 Tax=Glycine max TaxID=3847 RepID=A0A0R0KY35_SOYBN